MEKAVEGGAEFIAAQQAHVAEAAAAEEARRAAAPDHYPRETGRGETWTDPVDGRTIIGTQYTYNTKEEALAAIDTARANGKDVLYMDPDNASYIAEQGESDYTITVED
jgi:hypothetical protein